MPFNIERLRRLDEQGVGVPFSDADFLLAGVAEEMLPHPLLLEFVSPIGNDRENFEPMLFVIERFVNPLGIDVAEPKGTYLEAKRTSSIRGFHRSVRWRP